jgi:MFS family permease
MTAEEAKKKIKRRQSFIAKVATSAGFDWDMLEELLGRRHVWLFLIYLALTTMGLALANFSLTAWCHETKGFGIDEVGILMSVMSIGCFLISLPMGYLFDLVPSKRSLMFIAAACMGGANLFLFYADTRLQVYVGLFLFGAAHGVVYVVQCSMARILADMRIAAAFFGLVDSICNLMHAFGTLFGGPIAERISLEANFIIGAAVDFLALFFCLLLPEAALRFSHEDVFDGKAKVLPHRVGLQFAQARRTALNTELRMLEARREELADEEEAAAAAGGIGGGAALSAKGPLVKLALFAGAAGGSGGEHEAEPDGVAVLKQPHEVLQMLNAVPAYVPMAHLAASARTGALAAADADGDSAAGFVNPLAAAQAANLARGSSGGRGAGGARRPSLYERASTLLEEATAPSTRAPRPVAPPQGFSLASVLSALGLPGGAPSASSSQGRRADAVAGGRALRRSSVAASIVDRLGVVGVGMGAAEAEVEMARRGRAGDGGGEVRGRSAGASSSPSRDSAARAVRNPLAATSALSAAGGEESGSDDTGDVTEEATAVAADHDPAPPPPPLPPPPPRLSSSRRAEAAAAAAAEAPAAVSTTSATSAAAFAASRRKRLEQMGAAGGGGGGGGAAT